jgi:hypothetical protein
VNVSAELSSEVTDWLGGLGWGGASVERLPGGTNNRVFKLTQDGSLAALKCYFRGEHDKRDRYGAERDFYRLSEQVGATQTARCLARDEEQGVALYSWVEGDPVGAPITSEDVAQAARFLKLVGHGAGGVVALTGVASEACFSVSAHCDLLGLRLRALTDKLGLPELLVGFLQGEVLPRRDQVESALRNNPAAEFREGKDLMIYSPGDFGFHNALRGGDGRITFIDFEYSGWDDPAKTIADVFLQPEKPVAWDLLTNFCGAMDRWPRLEERARSWIPFFALKWCCILLNPLVKEHAERRIFAGAKAGETGLDQQLEKARHVLDRSREIFS